MGPLGRLAGFGRDGAGAEGVGDAFQRPSDAAPIADLADDGLFGFVRDQGRAVSGEVVAVGDRANALAVGALHGHCRPGPLAGEVTPTIGECLRLASKTSIELTADQLDDILFFTVIRDGELVNYAADVLRASQKRSEALLRELCRDA